MITSALNKAWFRQRQEILLKIANTRYGRELLAINPDLPEIVAVRPNSVTARISEREFVSEFSTRSKYSVGILYRAAYVAEFANYLKHVPPWQIESLTRQVPVLAMATDTTFYPEPDPETSSTDGDCEQSGTNATFATLRGGAGDASSDTTATRAFVNLTAGTTTDRYNLLRRAIYVFDTSSITDSDNITVATFSQYVTTLGQQGLNNGTGETVRVVLVSSSPAADNDVASGDFDSLGGTSFGESAKHDDLTVPGYNDITLNASGLANISKTAASKFGLLWKFDFANDLSDITWASGGVQSINGSMADTADTTQDPKLTVTHVAALVRNFAVVIS